ncbi:MAG: hypothetical protein ACOYU7_10030, partial [Bacillota bacterium]
MLDIGTPEGNKNLVSLSISAATNRITTPGFAYDAAGHMTQWPGGTVTLGADYDVEGRLSVVKQDGVKQRIRGGKVSSLRCSYFLAGLLCCATAFGGDPKQYTVCEVLAHLEEFNGKV